MEGVGMAGGNYVSVRGRVLRDERERFVRDGLSVIDFTLAVDYPDGDKPVYVDCYGCNDACDALDGFVEAGEVISVEGYLTFRTYTTKSGQRRSGMVVYAESVVAADSTPSETIRNQESVRRNDFGY